MKKKLKEEVFVEPEVVEPVDEVKKVSKLDLDFGREDLNKLRDKVNELVELS